VNAGGLGRPAQHALVVLAIVLAVGALHLARSAVVPVLFAVFLAVLLSPGVAALARWRVPRALAAAIVIAALVAAVALALNATWRPARAWLDAAPATMRMLERKLQPVTRIIAKVESVSEQAGRVADPAVAVDAAGPTATSGAADKSTMRITTEWLIASVTMLMVVYFLLAGGPPLLVRLEALRGGATGTRLLQLASVISSDLGRYFATVTLSNLLLGIGTTVTMHWLGMPNALLWGAVAFLLNYVPYAGSATTFVLLTAVALVSFDGLGRAFAVAGTYLLLTTIEGQIVQPILVGRRLDVHPLVVLLSLWFGGWLWGVAGVALAMPLVVTAKALAIELLAGGAESGSAPKDPSTVRSRAMEIFARSPARQRRPEEERR
jgi:predicted PurR-regulated permease PerM